MITFERNTLVLVGAASLAVAALSGTAFSNQHPHPHKGSLDYLDRNSYAKNMRVLGVFGLGEERGHKLQMMVIGARRFILQNGDVIDVSDPRAPKLVKHGAFRGSQLQVAYNRKLGKWILITGASSPITSTTATAPNGKYDDPSLIEKTKQGPGLRGIRIWDATDPANIVLLSEFSTDGGDPKRKVQAGSGTHRNYYDGGDYAYLDTAPDDSFTNMESPIRWHGNGIMVVDVSDPANPKQVAMWWVPGQRTGEEAQYKAWREYGDKVSFTSLHGPMYVPKKAEDGGKLGYSAYGSFGMLIHDLSDIRNPKLVGRFWRAWTAASSSPIRRRSAPTATRPMSPRGSSTCATRLRRRRFRGCRCRRRRAMRPTRLSAKSAGVSARTTRRISRPPENPIPTSPAMRTSTRACSVTTFAIRRARASWRTSSRRRAASSTSGTATTAPWTMCSSSGTVK